ncbi:MAG: FHA domain-containing protein [Solobacterium sp.]|jgi:hypothetical protein|nr:FHA domain-containing protein [Solobacterium sp.]MCH4049098.1 FHA domain-containing protein [Solobacterium sp.]MCH4074148.1 FHA domain-containing protein [Solobacterium sp.]MCI1314194.1 FHA domain-containing protein [Solobacterium sp.]MCI1346364.1 FHA domain-containing protein [Solobacterium sp.]
MSRIFNDPTLAKAAVLLLGGMVIVLLIAVVVLALKKYQVYYIDDEEIDQQLKEKEKNKLNLKLPKVKKPEKKVKEVKETEEVEEEPVKEAEEVKPQPAVVKPVEAVKSAEAVIQEPEDLVRPDAAKPQEKTDTTFIPEMNNVPPVNHTVPRAKEPGQKLYGVRITITVGAQRTTADVTDFPCLIGREADKCDVIISEPAVSRRHARLLKEDDQLLIEDVSEHNGTYLNEMKIPPLGKVRIHEGDSITLGRAHIRIDSCLYQ